MLEIYIEKRNTINQKFPLQFVLLRVGKKTVTVQDKGRSRKAETMKIEDFNATYQPKTA